MFSGVDNSSSFNADNCKNNFLVLGEGQTYGINGNFGNQRRILLLIVLRQKQNFARVCIIMVMIVICLLIEKKSPVLKPIIKMVTFQLNFV